MSLNKIEKGLHHSEVVNWWDQLSNREQSIMPDPQTIITQYANDHNQTYNKASARIITDLSRILGGK